LISNGGSIAGLVTPFVGGAMATTAAVTKSMIDRAVKTPAKAAGTALNKGAAAGGGAALNAARNAMGGSSGPAPVKPPPTPGGSSPSGSSATPTDSSRPNVMTAASALEAVQAGSPAATPGVVPEASNTDSTPPPSRRDVAQRRGPAQQARRGAIIHQQKARS